MSCIAAVTFKRPRERHVPAYMGRVSTEATSAAFTSAAPRPPGLPALLIMDSNNADAPATNAAACDVPAPDAQLHPCVRMAHTCVLYKRIGERIPKKAVAQAAHR